ncbi:MAG: hypothetical protein AAFP81_07195 [Pseudomonadota bacterium]
MIFAKIGAVAYALWSLLHIALGVERLIARADAGMLSEAAGRLAQGHWTLIWVGVLGLGLSWYNWRNNTVAYWLSAFLISVEDIGFLLFPVWQGGLGLPAAAIGPGLWIIGLVFTTIAYVSTRPQPSDST